MGAGHVIYGYQSTGLQGRANHTTQSTEGLQGRASHMAPFMSEFRLSGAVQQAVSIRV